jgi:hypothetical protein
MIGKSRAGRERASPNGTPGSRGARADTAVAALPDRREHSGNEGESGADREDFNFDGSRHDRVPQQVRINARRIGLLTIQTPVSSLWQR